MKVYDPDSNPGPMPLQGGVYAGRPDYYPLQPQKPIGVFQQYTMHDQEVSRPSLAD